VPVKKPPVFSASNHKELVNQQQSIESIINNNATELEKHAGDDGSNLIVSVQQEAPKALQAGIPGMQDMVLHESSFPSDKHGPKVLQEAASAVVPSSIVSSSELNNSSLSVIVKATPQGATNIQIGDNLNVTVDQPIIPKALQE